MAYDVICEFVFEKLYCWEVIEVNGKPANALIGRTPSKSNLVSTWNYFDGSNDPYFNEAIEVIMESIKEYNDFMKKCYQNKWIKKYFKLLRNYILLWSAVERFLS